LKLNTEHFLPQPVFLVPFVAWLFNNNASLSVFHLCHLWLKIIDFTILKSGAEAPQSKRFARCVSASRDARRT